MCWWIDDLVQLRLILNLSQLMMCPQQLLSIVLVQSLADAYCMWQLREECNDSIAAVFSILVHRLGVFLIFHYPSAALSERKLPFSKLWLMDSDKHRFSSILMVFTLPCILYCWPIYPLKLLFTPINHMRLLATTKWWWGLEVEPCMCKWVNDTKLESFKYK